MGEEFLTGQIDNRDWGYGQTWNSWKTKSHFTQNMLTGRFMRYVDTGFWEGYDQIEYEKLLVKELGPASESVEDEFRARYDYS